MVYARGSKQTKTAAGEAHKLAGVADAGSGCCRRTVVATGRRDVKCSGAPRRLDCDAAREGCSLPHTRLHPLSLRAVLKGMGDSEGDLGGQAWAGDMGRRQKGAEGESEEAPSGVSRITNSGRWTRQNKGEHSSSVAEARREAATRCSDAVGA